MCSTLVMKIDSPAQLSKQMHLDPYPSPKLNTFVCKITFSKILSKLGSNSLTCLSSNSCLSVKTFISPDSAHCVYIHNHSLVDSDLTSGDMKVFTDRQKLDDRQVRLLELVIDNNTRSKQLEDRVIVIFVNVGSVAKNVAKIINVN